MITYENVNKVNATLETTNIKGKNYVEVNQRVKAFRQLIPNGRIETTIVRLDSGVCTIRAEVYDGEGHALASGIAEEKESSSFINKTSYVENCETSAVGRALGFLGIGIDASICTADEVGNAINNQAQPGEEQRNYKSEIETYSALLAENSKQSPDEWKQAAQAKYKTDKGQADCLISWWNKQKQ